MQRKPKTIRLAQEKHDFIRRSDFNFSLHVRQFIFKQRVEYATGRCAACGIVVYEGKEQTLVEESSQLSDVLGLDSFSGDLELCGECFDRMNSALSRTDKEKPTLEYLQKTGPAVYKAERLAIKDAKSDKDQYWGGLLEDPDRDLKMEMIFEWANHPETDDDRAEIVDEIDREAPAEE